MGLLDTVGLVGGGVGGLLDVRCDAGVMGGETVGTTSAHGEERGGGGGLHVVYGIRGEDGLVIDDSSTVGALFGSAQPAQNAASVEEVATWQHGLALVDADSVCTNGADGGVIAGRGGDALERSWFVQV